MKKSIVHLVVFVFFGVVNILGIQPARASHIIGGDIHYRWLTGLTYEVTMDIYGDCSSTSGSFPTLYFSTPMVCIYNGDTLKNNLNLRIQSPDSGVFVSPACPDSVAYTTCTSLTYDIPGIKKFVYLDTITLPFNSSMWRFVYEGYNGSGSAAGRTAAITNLYDAGATILQLIDTLNTKTSRGHNSSPLLNLDPAAALPGYVPVCVNPGASDLYDSTALDPTGDSLVYSLIVPTNSSSGGGTACAATLSITNCAYISGLDAWETPTVQPMSATTPMECTSGTTFSFNSSTGNMCFTPVSPQRSTVVYNIEEYYHDTLVGTIQREANILVGTYGCLSALSAPGNNQVRGLELFPNPARGSFTISSSETIGKVEVLTVMGQVVISSTFSGYEGVVDVSGLPDGVYIVRINDTAVKRFVKE